MRAIYVAHPLGQGADREANRAHAARWVAWVAASQCCAPVADWIILSGEWSETAELRAAGIAIDKELIARCDEVWLVGGRISEGMRIEAEHAWSLGKHVSDLTSFGPEPPKGARGLVRTSNDPETKR